MSQEGRFFDFLNPIENPTFLLIIAYSVRRLPYVVRSAVAGFQQTSETLEEAGAALHELIPYGLYNICHVNQIYLMFRAQLNGLNFSPGKESLEVRLFAEEEIPWEDLAFPVIEQTLARYITDRPRGVFPFHIEDIVRRLGSPSAEGGVGVS